MRRSFASLLLLEAKEKQMTGKRDFGGIPTIWSYTHPKTH
jgi:hypothetical protein